MQIILKSDGGWDAVAHGRDETASLDEKDEIILFPVRNLSRVIMGFVDPAWGRCGLS